MADPLGAEERCEFYKQFIYFSAEIILVDCPILYSLTHVIVLQADAKYPFKL